MIIDEISTSADLNEVLLKETRGVMVDFWGTWCQPCRSLRPHLERFADDFCDDWRIVAVRTDDANDLVDRFNIRSTPTLVYVKQGEEVHRSTGAVTPSTVDEALRSLR